MREWARLEPNVFKVFTEHVVIIEIDSVVSKLELPSRANKRAWGDNAKSNFARALLVVNEAVRLAAKAHGLKVLLAREPKGTSMPEWYAGMGSEDTDVFGIAYDDNPTLALLFCYIDAAERF